MSSSFEGVYEPGVVDPGIPIKNATVPFWHSDMHPLSNHQSPWPSTPVDVAIIGSGITGVSLARTLLSRNPALRVVILDARGLCSGATARNGGHIKTMAYAVWLDRTRAFGIDEAIRLTEFEHGHLDAMVSCIRQGAIDCDLVLTTGVDAYYDQHTFDAAVAALNDMRIHAPELAGKHRVYTDPQRLRGDFKLSPRCIGAICVPAASVWPYKFVMGILQQLMDGAERGNLNLQPHTAVLSVQDDPTEQTAVVKTTRGDLLARHVIHATNGWLGHLLPDLRPFVSPVRGNVVHYQGVKEGVSPGPQYSFWLRYAAKDYDYLIQRAEGDIVVGRANTGRKATADDSQTDLAPMAHLRGMAEETLAGPAPAASAAITHAWSGILAFTQDAMPFVGRVPGGRYSHQWVCGGYHGIGMVKAFRTAQLLALMVLGEELPEEYPRSMLLTNERLGRLKESLAGNGGKLQSKM